MVFGYSGGAISFATEKPDSTVLFISLGLAFLSTVITNMVLKVFRKIEDETLIETEAIGSHGTVTVDIPAGGYGEAEVNINGSVFSLTASSNDHMNIGDIIVVEAITSPGLVKVIPSEIYDKH
ncbi:MAG: hypothetical protein H9W81_13970 [Enterococcus sp.]|nr:hypothetical protein [Enterococcus sp.]